MLGSILGAVGGIASAFLGKSQADKNVKLQKEFAQKGIQWKVDDANKAGIHPLYALGANTTSFSPVSVGGPDLSFLGDMGQDIDRSRMATSSAPIRGASRALEALTLERASLENDLLRSQIRRSNAPSVGPALPGMIPEEVVNPQRTSGVNVGVPVVSNPHFSDAQSYEDRYGELGGSALGLLNFPADIYHAAKKYIRDHPDLYRAGGYTKRSSGW